MYAKLTVDDILRGPNIPTGTSCINRARHLGHDTLAVHRMVVRSNVLIEIASSLLPVLKLVDLT